MNIKITVQQDELNDVLSAIRSAGIRHVNLDQVEDAVELSLELAGDMTPVIHAIEGAKRKRHHASGYERLSHFASARPRNPDGSFATIKRPISGTMRKTG